MSFPLPFRARGAATPAPPTRGQLLRLFAYLPSRRKWQLAGLLCLMLLGGVAEMATLGAVVPVLALLADPGSAMRYPQARLLLHVTGAAPGDLLMLAITALVVVAVAGAAIRMLLFATTYRFTFGIGGDIGREVYRRTLLRSYSWHVSRNSSEILAAIEKVNTVTNSVIVQLMQGGVALVVGVAILASLLLIDARTALVAGGGFVSLYLCTTVLGRRFLRRNARSVAANRTNRIRSVQEGLGGIRDVLIDGTQPVYLRRFVAFDRAMRTSQASNAFISASPRVVMETAGVLLILLLAFLLSARTGGLATAVPTLGALALGAQKLLPQMQQVYVAWSAIAGSRGELADVLALLDAPLAPEHELGADGQRVLPAPRPDAPLMALRDVSFRYHADSPVVLRHVDLAIERGTRVGVVGTTGSGKSTLIDLLLGLLPPTEGVIEIAGHALEPATVRAWQCQIAHVPQSIHLIDGTIAENIALGVAPDRVDWPRLETAARVAQLAPFVAAMAAGYDSTVGERGVRLSGGQRQRIGLARALYKSADVLVLDEATSALDNETEQKVMAGLDEIGPEITVLMIAHRLSTIRNCNRIVVVDHGRIAAVGDWESLMASSVEFRAIAAAAGTTQNELAVPV